MSRLFFSVLASIAVVFVACERHPAGVLKEEHGAGPETAATQNKSSDTQHHNMALPHAPQGIPTNPAGSAPVSNQAARESTGQPQPEAVPQYSPDKK